MASPGFIPFHGQNVATWFKEFDARCKAERIKFDDRVDVFFGLISGKLAKAMMDLPGSGSWNAVKARLYELESRGTLQKLTTGGAHGQFLFSTSSGLKCMWIQMSTGGIEWRALIDTGATLSVMSAELRKKGDFGPVTPATTVLREASSRLRGQFRCQSTSALYLLRWRWSLCSIYPST